MNENYDTRDDEAAAMWFALCIIVPPIGVIFATLWIIEKTINGIKHLAA